MYKRSNSKILDDFAAGVVVLILLILGLLPCIYYLVLSTVVLIGAIIMPLWFLLFLPFWLSAFCGVYFFARAIILYIKSSPWSSAMRWGALVGSLGPVMFDYFVIRNEVLVSKALDQGRRLCISILALHSYNGRFEEFLLYVPYVAFFTAFLTRCKNRKGLN